MRQVNCNFHFIALIQVWAQDLRSCSSNHCTTLPKSFLWFVEALCNMATAYLSGLIPSLTISLPELTGLCDASRTFSLIFSRTPHHGSYILLFSPHLDFIHPSRILLDIASSVSSSHYSPDIKHGREAFHVSILIVTPVCHPHGPQVPWGRAHLAHWQCW